METLHISTYSPRNTISEKQGSGVDGTVLNLCLNYYKVIAHLEQQVKSEVEGPLVSLAQEQDRLAAASDIGSASSRPYPAVARGLLIKFNKDGVSKLEALFVLISD